MNFVAWIFDTIQLTLRYLISFWMAIKNIPPNKHHAFGTCHNRTTVGYRYVVFGGSEINNEFFKALQTRHGSRL